MFLKEEISTSVYSRKSKLGVIHSYIRKSRICIFRCDSCGVVFSRKRENISPKRLSNNYFHCCSNCDSKKFAQQKGVDRRTIWDKPASILDDVSKL